MAQSMNVGGNYVASGLPPDHSGRLVSHMATAGIDEVEIPESYTGFGRIL